MTSAIPRFSRPVADRSAVLSMAEGMGVEPTSVMRQPLSKRDTAPMAAPQCSVSLARSGPVTPTVSRARGSYLPQDMHSPVRNDGARTRVS